MNTIMCYMIVCNIIMFTRGHKAMGSQEVKLFAKRLHELRVKKGVSQEELAERAGLHRNYVGRLERAMQSPSLDRICDLARALGVKPAELLKSGR
jgi:ribosome-binding protein aMBF1 (putative translation factor)